ncbi:MAG: hypothetical protein DKT66_06540 [Candidatus Melainabacteria bacterium]|nr:MAG: hypothetical protein DKT66_06540 [Candidatus Melainabacteria bacterium]
MKTAQKQALKALSKPEALMISTAEATSDDVLAGLFGKIYEMMTEGDSTNPSSAPLEATSFLSFCKPGIAIDNDDLDFGDQTTMKQIQSLSNFSQLVNSIPNPTEVWSKTQGKVWDVYGDAITSINLPVKELTPQQEQLLARAKKVLYTEVFSTDPVSGTVEKQYMPTPAYKAYKQKFTEYMAALRKYNNIMIAAKKPNAPADVIQDWNLNGPVYEQEKNIAESEWHSFGFKDEVETAEGAIERLTGQGPEALYKGFRAELNGAKRKDGFGITYYPTFAFPPNILSSAYDDSWTNFTYKASEAHDYSSKTKTKWGGGGGFGIGLFSVGGSVERQNENTFHECDTSGLEMSVELLQVPLISPWLRTQIFKSRGWDWLDSHKERISNGTIPPSGMMPLIPNSIILARKLSVSLNKSSEVNKTSMSKLKASASAGWGPFSVKGNYSRSDSSASRDFHETDTGFSFEGPQIIGFMCEILPMSPNPDLEMTWPQSVFSELLDRAMSLDSIDRRISQFWKTEY